MHSRKHPFFWLVLISGTIIFGLYVFAGTMILKYWGLSDDVGWDTAFKEGGWRVSRVDPRGPAAAKLQIGDRVDAIDGDTRVGRVDPLLKVRLDVRGASYAVQVAREYEKRQYVLDLVHTRDPQDLEEMLYFLPASLAFYIIGLLVGLIKPSERIPQSMVIASLVTSVALLELIIRPLRSLFHGWEVILYFVTDIIYPFHFVLGYRFFHRFASGDDQTRNIWARLQAALFLVAVIVWTPRTISLIATLPGSPVGMTLLFDHSDLFRLYWDYSWILASSFQVFSIVCMAMVLVYYYRRTEQADQRRRSKWVVYGTSAGLLPHAGSELIRLATLAVGRTSQTEALVNTLWHITTAMPVIVPVTFGYAVAKHRVLGIEVVVRRGFQYLLARNALRLVLLLPVIGLVYEVVANRNRTVQELLFHQSTSFYLFLLVTGSFSLRFRRQIRDWLDRKFFREAHQQERILMDLIEKIRGLDSVLDVSRLVGEKLDLALHPSRVFLFCADKEAGDLALGYSSGGSATAARIPADFALLRLMRGRTKAEDLPFRHEDQLPSHEQQWLEQLGVQLIVPVESTGLHLAGLLLLGQKKSEEPYSRNDKKLLEAIAAEIAVVFENIWLKQRVDHEERIRRKVLAKLDQQQINLLKECPSCGACYDRTDEVCSKDNRELSFSLPVERVIDGRYRLEHLVGKGGTGAVYEATDVRLNRRVAVKVMIGAPFGEQATLRRFEREARAAAHLNHRNIITVHDYGLIGDEGAYLAMELVCGSTWRAELTQFGNLDPPMAAEWFDQVMEGMKFAHAAGVIHRDLKPENVLIANQGGQTLLKILDFGLAKVTLLDFADRHTLTVPGVVLGTFGYMSPEQLSGEEVDERSDIFSLGVMVFEAVTGERPFRGKTHTELFRSTLQEPFQLPGDSTEVNRLRSVLQTCLSKDRDRRYAKVAALQWELIPALRACPKFPLRDGRILAEGTLTKTVRTTL